jgi:hypothetical protein
MTDPNASVQERFSLNPSFKQLAFLIAVVLLLLSWKFGLEGIME